MRISSNARWGSKQSEREKEHKLEAVKELTAAGTFSERTLKAMSYITEGIIDPALTAATLWYAHCLLDKLVTYVHNINRFVICSSECSSKPLVHLPLICADVFAWSLLACFLTYFRSLSALYHDGDR